MRFRGELVAIVSMDRSKAFIVVQHDLLLVKLQVCGIMKREVACYLRITCQGDDSELRLGIFSFPPESALNEQFLGKCDGTYIFFNLFINDLFNHVM